MRRALKKDHLIEVAAKLFNRYGYHAAGVDRVIAEAGIAKTTLYRHFKSKDDLIVAVLRRVDAQYRDNMREAVDKSASEPWQKILATFDVLETWFAGATFFGCPFMSAASEYGDRSNPVFQEVVMHKRLMVAYFEELARGAELENPHRAAETIHLLHEGATAVAQVIGEASAAAKAKTIAAKVLKET
ncbi:MAG: TetR/AcrR family transcriptional regulator [Alphaproteobacteria bacterium]|nr:TetR/AcrR family transcriptional regulator [Alphaproteobacteria bacterium]